MLDDKTRALLGDHEAAQRLTDAGILLPCPFCGSQAKIKVPQGASVFPSDIYYNAICTECFALGPGGKSARYARHIWNTRAAILTPEQLDVLEGME